MMAFHHVNVALSLVELEDGSRPGVEFFASPLRLERYSVISRCDPQALLEEAAEMRGAVEPPRKAYVGDRPMGLPRISKVSRTAVHAAHPDVLRRGPGRDPVANAR